MKFNPKYRPERAVSTDVTRNHISEVYLDADKQVMVGCDGHMIAIVPCVVEPGDRSGHIPTAAYAEARRVRKYGDSAKIKARKSLADSGRTLHRRDQRAFVPWEDVVRDFVKRGDKDTITFGVNPKLLLALAEAIGACSGRLGASPVVVLTVSTKKDLGAIRVDGQATDATAVLMPVRL